MRRQTRQRFAVWVMVAIGALALAGAETTDNGDIPEKVRLDLLMHETRIKTLERRVGELEETVRLLSEKDLGMDEAVRTQVEKLKNPSRFTRRDAISALGAMGVQAEPAIPALIEVLQKDEDKWARNRAVGVLGAFCRNTRVNDLLRRKILYALKHAAQKDEDAEVRKAAVEIVKSILK